MNSTSYEPPIFIEEVSKRVHVFIDRTPHDPFVRVCVSLDGQPEDCTDLTEEETRSLIAELQAGLAVLEQREPVPFWPVSGGELAG